MRMRGHGAQKGKLETVGNKGIALRATRQGHRHQAHHHHTSPAGAGRPHLLCLRPGYSPNGCMTEYRYCYPTMIHTFYCTLRSSHSTVRVLLLCVVCCFCRVYANLSGYSLAAIAC